MVQCHSGFTGVDTMNITSHSNFSKTSYLLSQHENASIIGRNDIRCLLNQKVQHSQISTKLEQSFIESAKDEFSIDILKKIAKNSTYVRFDDMILINLFETSESKQNITVINDVSTNRRRQKYELSVQRSWPFLINLLQTEDKTGFGTQFRAIPQFARVIDNDKQSTLTWTLFAILSSIKDLWHIINTKLSPFCTSSWKGWILCDVTIA